MTGEAWKRWFSAFFVVWWGRVRDCWLSLGVVAGKSK